MSNKNHAVSLFAIFLFFFILLGTTANAANLITSGGQLIGASNVDINGSLYYVEFADGTCVSVFDGCDEQSDFTFNLQSDVLAAANALLDQVLIDSAEGAFDSSPELTSGCSSLTSCIVATPFSISPSQEFISTVGALNFTGTDGTQNSGFSSTFDLANSPNTTFAVWSPAATPIVSGGQLVGAQNVKVNGDFYNVSFVDGTCTDIFEGCDQQSDIIFASEAEANAASSALLNQVLLDGPLGLFDSESSTTIGCDNTFCRISTPYLISPGLVATRQAGNVDAGTGEDFIGGTTFQITSDVTLNSAAVYAVWVPANDPPTADAGVGSAVAVGDTALLNGSASTDDQTPVASLGFNWSLVSKPSGSVASLSNTTSTQIFFVPDLPGDYLIELVVTDQEGLSSQPDQVQVTAEIIPAFLFTTLATGSNQYIRIGEDYSSSQDYYLYLDFNDQSVTAQRNLASYSYDAVTNSFESQREDGVYRLSEASIQELLSIGDPADVPDSQFYTISSPRNIDSSTVRFDGGRTAPSGVADGTYEFSNGSVTEILRRPINISGGGLLSSYRFPGRQEDLIIGYSNECLETRTRSYFNGTETVTYDYCAKSRRGLYRLVNNIAEPIIENTQNINGIGQLENFRDVAESPSGYFFVANYRDSADQWRYGLFHIADSGIVDTLIETHNPNSNYYRATVGRIEINNDGQLNVGIYDYLERKYGIFAYDGSDFNPIATNINSPLYYVDYNNWDYDNDILAYRSYGFGGNGLSWQENERIQLIAENGTTIDNVTYDSLYLDSHYGRRAINGHSLVFRGQDIIVNSYDDVTGDHENSNSFNVLLARLDTDRDSLGDDLDNCPTRPNPDQVDTNGDGVGDLCVDTDADSIFDDLDNCPLVANSDQLNTDSDSFGDSCDVCPLVDDPLQSDIDGDGDGDLCDLDLDNDGVNNDLDNCPLIANDQADLDNDTLGDICDSDIDGDGINNLVDGQIVNGSYVDESEIPSQNFSDQNIGGVSYGSIQSNGGLTVLVEDASESSSGLTVTADTGTGQGSGAARIKQCDFRGRDASIDLIQGSSIEITCGSIGVNTLANRAFILLDDDVLIDVGQDTSVLVTDTADLGFNVTNNPDSISSVEMMLQEVKVKIGTSSTGNITSGVAGEYSIANDPGSAEPLVVEKDGVVIIYEPGDEGTPVLVDVKPGDPDNTINLGSNGVVNVAILSSDSFDATEVDPTSVTMASAPARLKGKGKPWYQIDDVNTDGINDLVVQVETDALELSSEAVAADVEGQTYSGEAFKSSDMIRVVPSN